MSALLTTKACNLRATQLIAIARLGTTATANGAVSKIGHREVVGHGFNGEASYIDRCDFPFPAVRFREPTAEIKAILQKEKGDWKNLSVDEKKLLYRYSFCQTLSELKAPTGEWKFCVGVSLILSSIALWMYVWMKHYVYSPMPESTTMENQRKQLRRALDLRTDPIDGVSSKWDYENDRWKN